jgi:hypothetical protein
LLRLLWKADILTFHCCQEDAPGIVWVEFVTAADAAAFLRLVTGHPADSTLPLVDDSPAADSGDPSATLYERILGLGRKGAWQYDVQPRDLAGLVDVVADGVLISPGTTQFDFCTSVRFPWADLPLVLDRVSTAVNDPKRMKHFAVARGDWRLGTAEYDPFPPLLVSLWQASIGDACAVDLAGRAGVQVQFSWLDDLQMFLDLTIGYAAEQGPRPRGGRDDASPGPFQGEALDAHILGCGCGSAWQYAVRLFDWSVREEVVNGEVRRRRIDEPRFGFSASVRFPRSDLPAIIERLSRAARDWHR